MTLPAALPRSPGIRIGGTRYPLVLPTVRDPRLHLLAVILSLQTLGQVAFAFRVSIAQILISLVTCGLIELAIVFRRQRVLMWPASALLTGNGVAFVLRVPGTEHGQWWSLHGAWIFAATAAGSLLSKHLVRFRGAHVFNPSNIGLVVCFLAIGPGRADPLAFWWGPMSGWMVLALAIIVAGGLAILFRLRQLSIAVSFWLAFVAGIAVVAATGHAMTARWHLGPIEGLYFWRVLATSPEVLVFLFFMITDPKTIPARGRARIAYAVSIGLLAALLIAPAQTEFWAKVALLGSLAIVCLARPLVALLPRPRLGARKAAVLVAAGVAAYAGGLVAAGLPARAASVAGAAPMEPSVRLPALAVAPSRGVDERLSRPTADRIARFLVVEAQSGRLMIAHVRRITMWLEAGSGQLALLVARVEGAPRNTAGRATPLVETVEITQTLQGYRIYRVRSS
jgi:hypothetical protein